MSTRSAWIPLGILLSGIALFLVLARWGPDYVGLLLGTGLITAAHCAVGGMLIAQGRPSGTLYGVVACVGAASWATWVWAAWEEYRAQMSLPIINVAGLPALFCTPVLLIALVHYGKKESRRDAS
ncbi:hypothetical protein [uncultured Corynebacterium sp.]|uniref:hypothetical protein n=1 Tax=uncultured Corynebacterium sp. TaxID=159447 RepID=UPI0025F9178F|nr:hypothetical protein [uncultured Corynebacterium sp.]